MLYEFICKADGSREYLDLPMDSAPEIGAKARHEDGRIFERVLSVPDVNVPQAFSGRGGGAGVESHSLPKFWKHHSGEFGPTGKPRFKNTAEIANACARAAHNDGTTVEHGAM